MPLTLRPGRAFTFLLTVSDLRMRDANTKLRGNVTTGREGRGPGGPGRSVGIHSLARAVPTFRLWGGVTPPPVPCMLGG